MPPLMLLTELLRSAGPRIWQLLIEGKEPEEIKLSDILDSITLNGVKRRAEIVRLRQKAKAAPPV